MKKRVADIVFETLYESGIDSCFTVVGGGAMHLNNALGINDNIKKIFNHHEQACTMAAEAYARFSGRMAIACVTSGPGATNALTGVMGAWEDSLPLLVLSGNVRHETSVSFSRLPLRYRGLQEFDITNSIKNMTKYNVYLTDPERVKYEVTKAISIAMEGRRGPVWIDIPQDIQNSLVESDNLVSFKSAMFSEKIKLQPLVDMLKKAKKPCLLIGSAIQTSHLEEQLESFMNLVDIPVVGGGWAGDLFYNIHPNYYGTSGNVGPRTGNLIIQEADLLLVLGNSLSYKQTGYAIESFAKEATIIMVDVDEAEITKHGEKIDVQIHSSLENFFNQYLMEQENDKILCPKEWRNNCELKKGKYTPYEGGIGVSLTERVNKYYFWMKFHEIAPKDCILALGNSNVCLAINQIGRKYKQQRIIGNYICGSMGYDLPAAIGTAVASKKDVVCVTGDGSIMMNLQELETIRYNNLPVKVIVFENDGYGAIKQTCKNFFDGVEVGCSPSSGVGIPSFEKVAGAFGFKYIVSETNSNVADTLKQFFKMEGNVMLEVKEVLDDPIVPKLMSKLDANGKMSSPTLSDLFPFIVD